MLDVNAFKAEMARNGYTQNSLAEALGMSPRTFYNRVKTGDFGALEIKTMIKLLNLKAPTAMAIFFAN